MFISEKSSKFRDTLPEWTYLSKKESKNKKGLFMMQIRKGRSNEALPLDLLLVADPSEERIARYKDRSDWFIADKAGETIGVYGLLPTGPENLELINLAVRENEQGKGYGKRLVKDAVNRARASGYKTIEVGTGNSSLNQLSLYQKCGFRIIGVDQGFFTRHYEEEIIENGILCKDMIRLAQEL